MLTVAGWFVGGIALTAWYVVNGQERVREMAEFLERLNNNRVLILKIAGNVAALLIALGYITVDQGKGITDGAVLIFAISQLVAGAFIGVVQRKNAVGLETDKKNKRARHGH